MKKIKRYELAPSGVAAHEVLTVSKIILAHTFHPKWESPNDLIDSLVETLGEIPIDAQLSTNQDESISRLKADLECHASSTLLLRQQEAASYPSLAILCIYFIRVLSLEFLGHEYYGTPFATKFRQNVIGVCIHIKSIFEDRFLIIDFLQLIFDLHVNDL